jgi:GNAT superfamily N-acetyltransferase
MNDATWNLRTACVDDLEIHAALLALLTDPGEAPLSNDSRRTIFRRMLDYPSYAIWLACDATGTARGTYTLAILDNLGHHGAALAVVENLVVHPDCRGTGLGRYMMEHARERAREMGCYKLMLSSNLRREEAHAFYDALGFERHGYSFRITP